MRNLKCLFAHHVASDLLRNVTLLTIDYDNNVLHGIVCESTSENESERKLVQAVRLVSCSFADVPSFTEVTLPFSDEELAQLGQLIGVQCVPHRASLFIATSNAIFEYNINEQHLEFCGSFSDGLCAFGFAPDLERFVCVTSGDPQKFLLFNAADFSLLHEDSVIQSRFGRAELVQLGWGSSERQFEVRGKYKQLREGDERTPAAVTSSKIASESDGGSGHVEVEIEASANEQVSWRPNGEFFAISSLNQSGVRQIRIWTRNGELHATNEHDLSRRLIAAPPCFRASSNILYAVYVRQGDDVKSSATQGHRTVLGVTLFETNGLKRHSIPDFSLLEYVPATSARLRCSVRTLKWNAIGDILAAHLVLDESHGDAHVHANVVQFWTISNATWYLKRTLLFQHARRVAFEWHDAVDGECFVLVDSHLLRVRLTRGVTRVRAHAQTEAAATVLVVNGSNVGVSVFEHSVIPPPLCTYRVNVRADKEPLRAALVGVSHADATSDRLLLVLNTGHLVELRHADADGQDVTHECDVQLHFETVTQQQLAKQRVQLFRRVTCFCKPDFASALRLCEPFASSLAGLHEDVVGELCSATTSGWTLPVPSDDLPDTLAYCALNLFGCAAVCRVTRSGTVHIDEVERSQTLVHFALSRGAPPSRMLLDYFHSVHGELGTELADEFDCVTLRTADGLHAAKTCFVTHVAATSTLRIGNHVLATDCTSYLATRDFLFYVTTRPPAPTLGTTNANYNGMHTLNCIKLTALDPPALQLLTGVVTGRVTASTLNTFTRPVERGARLVDYASSTLRLVMETGRGSLETLELALLVIDRLVTAYCAPSDSLECEPSALFEQLLRARINLTLLHDLDPALFDTRADRFVRALVNSPRRNALVIFVCDLVEADTRRTLYADLFRTLNVRVTELPDCKSKVNRICQTLLASLERLTDADAAQRNVSKRCARNRYLLELLACLVKQSPPRIITALRLVSDAFGITSETEGESEKQSKQHVSIEACVAQLAQLTGSDAELLVKASLATYDTHALTLVGDLLRVDPAEYVPLLGELQTLARTGDRLALRFRVNAALKRHLLALSDLLRLVLIHLGEPTPLADLQTCATPSVAFPDAAAAFAEVRALIATAQQGLPARNMQLFVFETLLSILERPGASHAACTFAVDAFVQLFDAFRIEATQTERRATRSCLLLFARFLLTARRCTAICATLDAPPLRERLTAVADSLLADVSNLPSPASDHDQRADQQLRHHDFDVLEIVGRLLDERRPRVVEQHDRRLEAALRASRDFRRLGELLERAGRTEEAFEAYLSARCYAKALTLLTDPSCEARFEQVREAVRSELAKQSDFFDTLRTEFAACEARLLAVRTLFYETSRRELLCTPEADADDGASSISEASSTRMSSSATEKRTAQREKRAAKLLAKTWSLREGARFEFWALMERARTFYTILDDRAALADWRMLSECAALVGETSSVCNLCNAFAAFDAVLQRGATAIWNYSEWTANRLCLVCSTPSPPTTAPAEDAAVAAAAAAQLARAALLVMPDAARCLPLLANPRAAPRRMPLEFLRSTLEYCVVLQRTDAAAKRAERDRPFISTTNLFDYVRVEQLEDRFDAE